MYSQRPEEDVTKELSKGDIVTISKDNEPCEIKVLKEKTKATFEKLKNKNQ